MLHKDCGSRLKQQYICIKDGSIVERDETVKGYEFAKDQYVQFTPEEIKALEEAGTHSIEISEFVPIESIDPVYFDKTYYLSPDKGADKPYGLLIEAMKEAKLARRGRWATRGKAYIVLIRPINDVLTMQQLHFAADVRPSTEVEVPKTEVKPQEMKLAKHAHRAADVRALRSERVHRRAPRPHPGRNPEESRRTGDFRGRNRNPKAAARSSI